MEEQGLQDEGFVGSETQFGVESKTLTRVIQGAAEGEGAQVKMTESQTKKKLEGT